MYSEEPIEYNYMKKYSLCPRLIDLNKHPKVRDETISVFISAMMGHIVKSWEALPCVKENIKNVQEKESNLSDGDKQSLLEEQQKDETTNLDEVLHKSSGLKKQLLQSNETQKSSEQQPQLLTQQDSSVPGLDGPLSTSKVKQSDIKITSSFHQQFTENWITICNDPSILIDDWRFLEGDQFATIEFKNGNKYKGRLSRNVMHGEGEFIWANGTVYKGMFDCGDITGKGKIQWPDLSWYEGDFYHGYRHGKGLLVIPELLTYYGDWIQGIRNGQGLLRYNVDPFESCYDITWKKGICSGYGLRIYQSGGQYDGNWKNGLQNGHGVMIWSNGDVYLGDWVEGKMEGIGKYIWYAFMSNEFVAPARNSYYGMWKANKKHGIGILETKSEVCIKGEWKDNLKHGFGQLICRNGIVIEKNPLFVNDQIGAIKFESNHPWIFMMKFDKMNVMKHNAGLINDKGGKDKINKRNKQDGCKDILDDVENNECYFSTTDNKNLCNINFNPATVPREYIDLSYYLIRLKNHKEIMKNFSVTKKNKIKTFDELKAPDLKIQINRASANSIRKYIDYDSKEPLTFFSFESKWLRNVISRHLPFLNKLYDEYAAKLCREQPQYPTLLPRLLLGQFFRDILIQKKGVNSLTIYEQVKSNPSCGIKDFMNPFTTIKFYQFLHYLIELSWEMYGKYNYGLQDTPGILASALEKLIEEDIKPNARNHNGISLLVYRDLLPFCDLYYNLYFKYNINTVRKFITFVIRPTSIINLLESSTSEEFKNDNFYQLFSSSANQCRNIFDFVDQPKYKKMKTKSTGNNETLLIPTNNGSNEYQKIVKDNMQSNPESSIENSTQENNAQTSTISKSQSTDNFNESTVVNFSMSDNVIAFEKKILSGDDMNKYSLQNIDVVTVLACIQEVCPKIKSGDSIINIDYKIVFADFYELLILCALKSIEIDKNKEKIKIDSNGNNEQKIGNVEKQTVPTTVKNKKRGSVSLSKK